MPQRSRGPRPDELRGAAMLAAAIFAVAAWCDLAGVALSSLPPPRIAALHTTMRATVAGAAPVRIVARPSPAMADGTPSSLSGRVFWLSHAFRPGDPHLVDVVGAGDVMMGSRDYGLNPALGENADAAVLLGSALTAIFRRADIAFANLEGPLYDGDDPPAKDCDHCYAFRSPTSYARFLAQLGLGAVSLANNHSGDFGEDGTSSTIEALRASKIGFCGLDRDGARIAEFALANGKRAALVAFAPNTGTLDINDADAEARIVRTLKQSFAIVIVSFHGGGEGEDYLHVADGEEYFHGEDRGNVVQFAHTAVAAGADIVIGQGPHVPRALEIYRGHLIAYSLGNFWTYGAIDTSAIRGAGPVLEAWLAPDGTVAGFAIHSTEQREAGMPRPDPANDAERTMLALTRSDFPDTAAMLDAAERDTLTK
jgi:hypothetical protein